MDKKKVYEMSDDQVNAFLKMNNENHQFVSFQVENMPQEKQQPGQLRGLWYRNEKGAEIFLAFSNPYFIKYAYELDFDVTECLESNIEMVMGLAKTNVHLEQFATQVVEIALNKQLSTKRQIKDIVTTINKNVKQKM